MKRIIIKLEYKCYPLWIYNENGELLDNNLPSELIGDEAINMLCDKIQEVFDGLYKNNELVFKYCGFKNSRDKEKFKKMVLDMKNMIKKKVINYYIVEEDVDFGDL